MARYPFARVPQDPPYITRSRPDNALVNVADDGSQILFILGQGRARGASRTVKNFIRQIPQSRFRGDKDRFPVLLDFCDSGNSVCDPVEILVKIRNSLVIRVNREVGISNLGTYLFAFDALYTIWCAKERIEKERLIPLAPTTLGRAGRAAVKLAITIASFGTVHYLGSLADAAGILREIASEAEGAVDIGREVVVDGIFERKTDDVQRFVHRFVAPRLSPRLRSAIGGRVLRSRDIWTFMLDILVDTIILVQKDLVKHGLFMLIADAIDEADDDDKNSIELRFVIGQLTVFLRTHSVATILSGRGPLRYWMEEFQVREEKLEEIPNDDIRRTFVQAGLDAAAIEEVLASAKSREATSAGALSEACKRLAIEWSVRAGF